MRFLLKFILNGIIVVPLLMAFTEATAFGALCTAVALCLIAYLLGDRLLLPATNNTVATLGDALLALVFLSAVAAAAKWSLSFTELFIIVVLVAVVEGVFHRVIAGNPLKQI